MSSLPTVTIRRTVRPEDAEGIGALHRRIYQAEYGMNDQFVSGVTNGVRQQILRGWPERHGASWLIDGDDGLLGSLGLTVERPGHGRVRWFVLDPSLRGQGVGRRMVDEMMQTAREISLESMDLVTFSALVAAAHLYRSVGFRVVAEEPRTDWGPPITFQHYELDLR
jgi:ribosomal protein S18 acetylase RimI-like enzyme